jgi:uncharacterized protein (DUF1499 family)
MARRRFAEDPTSRLAVWARRCAFFALTATVMSIIIVRSDLLELVPAISTYAGALLFAVLAVVLAFGAFIVIWKDGSGGMGYALSALFIGLALIAYPSYLGYLAYTLPMINDITTDPIDPPKFDVLARLRSRGTTEYAGLYAAELQRKAYPDVEPLNVNLSPKEAYDTAMASILRRKWRVVVDRPPLLPRREGHIEAVARTPIMGFRDDVTVRVRPADDGARIDVRSASRYGRHDFGSNATRIKALLEDIDDRISTAAEAKAEKPLPKPAKAAKPAPAKAVPAPVKREPRERPSG